LGVTDVDHDVLGQAQLELVGGQRLAGRALQPRQRRAEVGRGMALGGLGPQGARDRGPLDHPALQGQEREQPL
jgi:hypothetical protein